MKFKYTGKDYMNFVQQPLSGSSFSNFMKLLVQNRFRVAPPLIPRAMYVAIMTAMLSPFRWYEAVKFNKKLEEVKIPQIIFIVGHFRSGTTFLHYLMGQDRNLAYVSTLETMAPEVFLGSERLFGEMVKKRLPDKRPMDDLEMRAGLPYEEEYALANMCTQSFYHAWYFPRKWDHYFRKYVLFDGIGEKEKNKWRNAYIRLLKKIAYKHDGKTILLKSPVNTGRIKELLEIFPDAKFLHIYRNPYRVYLSTWKLYRKILPIFSFQHIDMEELDRNIITFYRETYKKYLKERHLIPDGNLVEISYETFYTDPMYNLEVIYDELGIDGFKDSEPYFRKFVKKYRNYTPDKYTMDEATREKVYEEWKFAFDAFGYDEMAVVK